MSISKRPAKNRGRRYAVFASGLKSASFRLPPTVSRNALLEKGSDERFRRLIYDLLTVTNRMAMVREYLSERMGITAPQYSLLMAIGQFQGSVGVGVTTIARLLHVSSAFVATETGKLEQAGLLAKRANPRDRRAVLLSLSRAGRALIERIGPEVRALNDVFFGGLSRSNFAAASAVMTALLSGSASAIARLHAREPKSWQEAAE
jgi:MarR family transcriptional regulator, organic hydroperoxide resistance regulator